MTGHAEGPKPSMGKRIWLMLAPDAKKDDDGRDNFNSRGQFVLCAMGGAVGLGNLLRFPSVIFNNHGLQFFIPYVIALFLIGIPILILEIVLGQAYRGGCVTAWNNVNHRAKGVGLSMVFNGFTVVGYYVPILAWAMTYFRQSFQSPLPWKGKDTEDYFLNTVVRNPEPVEGDDGWMSYSTGGLIGETTGWCFFIWGLTLMCTFKGVGLQGRVIYITMALPLVMIFILAVRSLSLPNASDGFRLYVGTWRTESLQGPQVWQDAFGQMFFSIGVGFGYFTSYASYNTKFANAVQDAFIVALSNSFIEIVSALAVMGIVGYLGMTPSPDERLGTFSSGFYTYPEALAQMPGSNFFSVLFFLTLALLGLTCVFALAEVLVTLICDTDWGRRVPRWVVSCTVLVSGSLISLIYCSEFGYMTLDAIDTFVNDVALFWTVWTEITFATTFYRWRDPVDQIGLVSYGAYNGGYVLAHFVGLLVAHLVSAEAGAGVAFGIFIIGVVVSTMVGKTPTVPAPRFWAKSPQLSRLWYAAFYSGNQLRRDLNRAIMTGNNWRLHWCWPVILKYLTAPAVGMVLSFAYPKFMNGSAKNPPYVYSFTIMHIVVVFIVGFAVFPRLGNTLIPAHRVQRGDGKYAVQPQITIGETLVLNDGGLEGGSSSLDHDDDIRGNTIHGKRQSSEVAEPAVIQEKST